MIRINLRASVMLRRIHHAANRFGVSAMYRGRNAHSKSFRNSFVGENLTVLMAVRAGTETSLPSTSFSLAGVSGFSLSLPWINERLNLRLSFNAATATASTARRTDSTTCWCTLHFDATAEMNSDALLGLPRGVPGAGCPHLLRCSLTVFDLAHDLPRLGVFNPAGCDESVSAWAFAFPRFVFDGSPGGSRCCAMSSEDVSGCVAIASGG